MSEQKAPELSEYRSMWLFAMFDLPMNTPELRKRYTHFRKLLLRQGFSMLQYSVYARYCVTGEINDIKKRQIMLGLPPDGQVRLLSVTDRQFAKMDVYFGKKRNATEKPPEQILLF